MTVTNASFFTGCALLDHQRHAAPAILPLRQNRKVAAMVDASFFFPLLTALARFIGAGNEVVCVHDLQRKISLHGFSIGYLRVTVVHLKVVFPIHFGT